MLLLRALQGQRDVQLTDAPFTLGRSPECMLTSLKVSRQHCKVRCDPASREAALLEPIKRVGVELRTGGRHVLDPGASIRLHPGDKLYLLPQSDQDWACGYQVQTSGLPAEVAGRPAAAPSLPAPGRAKGTASGAAEGAAQIQPAEGRPSKRHKPAAPLADVSPPATPVSPPPPAKPTLAATGASKRPAPAHRPRTTAAAVPRASSQHPPVFEGCRLTFWARSHAQVLISKATQLGAQVEETVTPLTTHVIARYDTSAEEASRKLGASSGLEYSALNSGSEPASVLPLPKGIHFVTPQYVSDCIAKRVRLPEEKYHIHLHKFQPPLPQPLPGSAPESQEAQVLAASAPSQSSQGPTQRPPVAEDALRGAWAGGEAGSAAGAVRGTSAGAELGLATGPAGAVQVGVPTAEKAVGTMGAARATGVPTAGGTGDAGAAGLAAAGATAVRKAWGYSDEGLPTVLPGDAAVQSAPVALLAAGEPAGDGAGGGGARPPQYTEKGMLVPPPEEVCPSVDQWGVGDRWVEPWDERAARESLQKLLSHWHKYQVHVPQGAQAPAPAPAEAGAQQAPGHPSPRQDASVGEAGATSVAAGTEQAASLQSQQQGLRCVHAACQALRGVCVVDELQKVRGSYLPGKRDEFRVKAINRAISVVSALSTPLQSEADVDALQLGTKTGAKLKEVLLTGRVERVAVMRLDDCAQTLALLLEVWGVAETTAERWYHQGCRTLEDAARRADLTETQRLGLKYFNDFQRRIPREEARECQRLVRDAVLEALVAMTALPREQLQDRLHVRITGSYLRGKRDCGDVDFVVAPPAAAAQRVVPADLLHAVLHILLGRHYITPDSVTPRKAHRQMHESATWLGVWKGPSSPCYRRVDIKVYPLAALPFAVNYFGSSKDFCKALRYWCNTPQEEVARLAAQHHPQATAFKLNDKGLFPALDRRSRRGAAGEGVQEDVLGPSLPASCETDIFRAVGLAYIPPHMREL